MDSIVICTFQTAVSNVVILARGRAQCDPHPPILVWIEMRSLARVYIQSLPQTSAHVAILLGIPWIF